MEPRPRRAQIVVEKIDEVVMSGNVTKQAPVLFMVLGIMFLAAGSIEVPAQTTTDRALLVDEQTLTLAPARRHSLKYVVKENGGLDAWAAADADEPIRLEVRRSDSSEVIAAVVSTTVPSASLKSTFTSWIRVRLSESSLLTMSMPSIRYS